jgi:hypothetical protein
MSEQHNNSDCSTSIAESGNQLLQTVQSFSWIVLAVLLVGSWIFYGQTLAISILIGGLLANVSFVLLRRDVRHFMDTFSAAGGAWKEVKRLEKVKFFAKFYGRLAVLAAILYLLATRIEVDLIGIAIGLSTIMFSVIAVVLSKGGKLYTQEQIKGA